MPATQAPPIPETPQMPPEEFYRPLYLKRVPERVWILVHDNAIRSRMRLQDYVVEVLESCQPFEPLTVRTLGD